MTDQLMFLMIVGTTVWVGFDSQELDMHKGRLGGGPIDMGTRAWVACCLVLWAIAFPCYLVARSKYVTMRDAPVSPAVVHAAPVKVQTAPPQLSPDGHWWWDGTQWVPAAKAELSQG